MTEKSGFDSCDRFTMLLSSSKRPDRLCRPQKPAVSSVQELFLCRKSGRSVNMTTRLYRASRLRIHGAKHPFPPVLLWEFAQLNSGIGLSLPYIFPKSHISSKTRNIFLIMGLLAFMTKWWDAGACKGICHRAIKPLMGVNNRHNRIWRGYQNYSSSEDTSRQTYEYVAWETCRQISRAGIHTWAPIRQTRTGKSILTSRAAINTSGTLKTPTF
jgi:hypothetical protein